MFHCYGNSKIPDGYGNCPVPGFAYPANRPVVRLLLDNYRQVSHRTMLVPQPPRIGHYPYKFAPNPYISSDDSTLMPRNIPCPPAATVRTNVIRVPGTRVAENSLQNSVALSTEIEDENVAAFNVGGEKRLCWNSLMETVLKNFSAHEINKKKSDLRIYTGFCSSKQLETLQLIGVLPLSQTHCSLISKSDAARLCSVLLRPPDKNCNSDQTSRSRGIDVSHDCFGGCSGTFITERYTHVNAKCIQCSQCGCIFSPQQFVSHNHKGYENRLCHWGFDSSEWRTYLQLADEDPTKELQKEWDSILSIKFNNSTVNYKRIASDASEGPQTKKSHVEETAENDTHKDVSDVDDNVYCKDLSEKEVDSPSSSIARPQFTGKVVTEVVDKSEVPAVDTIMSRDSSEKNLPLVASAGLVDNDNANLIGLANVCSEVVKNKGNDNNEDIKHDDDLSDTDSTVLSKALRRAQRKIAKLQMSLEKANVSLEKANMEKFKLQEEVTLINDGRKAYRHKRR